jgi:hypothetical protein
VGLDFVNDGKQVVLFICWPFVVVPCKGDLGRTQFFAVGLEKKTWLVDTPRKEYYFRNRSKLVDSVLNWAIVHFAVSKNIGTTS